MTRYRPGGADDSRLVYDIFVAAIDDLGTRTGGGANATAAQPSTAWDRRRPMFEHLAATADTWWIAEDEAAGTALGYARTILRDGVRELTEFFVLPSVQGGGIGAELMARAFPPDGARHRSIIATLDPRAVARYLRTGLDGRLPMVFFEGPPRSVTLSTDLARTAIDAAAPPFDELGAIDRVVLGFRRDVDHAWLASQRPGWLYRRGDRAVGYAYHPAQPSWGGPYAALDAADLPVLLADGERAAAEAGQDTVTFDVALTARTAIDHLQGRGFRIDPFMLLLFTDGPVDGMDRYVLTSPPFFA